MKYRRNYNDNGGGESKNDASYSMDLNPFDQALIDAFLPLLYPPPSSNVQSFVNDHI
jgi:hypothetical protein